MFRNNNHRDTENTEVAQRRNVLTFCAKPFKAGRDPPRKADTFGASAVSGKLTAMRNHILLLVLCLLVSACAKKPAENASESKPIALTDVVEANG